MVERKMMKRDNLKSLHIKTMNPVKTTASLLMHLAEALIPLRQVSHIKSVESRFFKFDVIENHMNLE